MLLTLNSNRSRFYDPHTETIFFLGLDLGQAKDYTALTIIERPPGIPFKYHVRNLKRFPIGTSYPEVVLAREMGMCYTNVSMVTDMDVHDPAHPVTVEQVFGVMKDNVEKVRSLLAEVIPAIPEQAKCNCSSTVIGSEF